MISPSPSVGLPLQEARAARVARPLGVALVAWIALVIVRNAWLCDDAFITFRTVDNFIQGRGLTWNPGQRVQAFTHPAWFFVVSAAYASSHEIYYTAIALGVAASVACAWLAVRALAASEWSALPVLVALSFSRAFIDYSTSGLENPLSHLLLVGWFACLCHPRWRVDSLAADLLTGVLVLNRLDLGLLAGPTWLWVMLQRRRSGLSRQRLVAHAAAASAPLLVWFAFATFYFGFALPNTAYAKLGMSIALGERFAQGFFYLLALIGTDPASALLLCLGLVSALRSEQSLLRCLGIGLSAYLIYIGYIGGDFMAGRFFSTPLMAAGIVLLRAPLERSTGLVLSGLFCLAGLAGPAAPMFSGAATEGRSGVKLELLQYRVMDERRFYYPDTGLLNADRVREMPGGRFRTSGERLAHVRGKVVAQLGMRAFIAGPDAALVDPFGLTDPFLARLPGFDRGPNSAWKAGHWKRPIPDGYRETISSGQNQLRDPQLARLYDQIQLITSGPLWSGARLRAIWQLNTGALAAPRASIAGDDAPESEPE